MQEVYWARPARSPPLLWQLHTSWDRKRYILRGARIPRFSLWATRHDLDQGMRLQLPAHTSGRCRASLVVVTMGKNNVVVNIANELRDLRCRRHQ